MTRKQERRRRVGGWLGTMAAGGVLAAGALYIGNALAAGVFVAGAGVLGHRRMIAGPGAVVLTYHSVSPDPAWIPWSREIAVHPATFERHLATLRAMGVTLIGTRAWCDARGRGEQPADAVIVHLDDGYLDNWLYAVPLLDRYEAPATFFASLDFVEPGNTLRARGGDERGYMNWAELRAVEAHPLFEVEPHGVDHARVPVSDRIVGMVTADNWRELAWMQWRATPGPKHDWFRRAAPVAVPLGSPVPASALALAEPAWGESAHDLETRIAHDLTRCIETFEARLARRPQIFCWPENKVGAAGRRIAATLGYRATTGGQQRNTRWEPAAVLSRIHMGDRAIGVRWPAMEALHLRAAVRLAQGNHYWYLVIAPMNAVRGIVMRVRARRNTGQGGFA